MSCSSPEPSVEKEIPIVSDNPYSVETPTIINTPTNSNLSDIAPVPEFLLCLLEGSCDFQNDYESQTVSFSENRFEAIITHDGHKVEITGVKNSQKSPFVDDERSHQEPYDWVTKLSIEIDGKYVFLPVSEYSDLTPPDKIYAKMKNEKLHMILKDGGQATFFEFVPAICDGQDTDEYLVTHRMNWYIPMFGATYTYSFSKFNWCA